jgi:hypothetical protein
MSDTYAKIQNGTIINTQVAEADDYFDPNYVWVVVTNTTCTDGSPVQIGCTTTDNATFSPSS